MKRESAHGLELGDEGWKSQRFKDFRADAMGSIGHRRGAFLQILRGNVSVFGDTDTTWSSFLLTVWWTESDLGRNGAKGVSAFVKFAQSRSLVPC